MKRGHVAVWRWKDVDYLMDMLVQYQCNFSRPGYREQTFWALSLSLSHAAFSPESLEVHSSFTWVGQTQYKLQLKPQEVLCLTLRACFLQAGVYNLNTPRVFAKLAEQGAMCETSQQAASPALIIINSARVEPQGGVLGLLDWYQTAGRIMFVPLHEI